MMLFNKDLAGIPGQLVSWKPSNRAEVLVGPAARLLLSEEGDLALSFPARRAGSAGQARMLFPLQAKVPAILVSSLGGQHRRSWGARGALQQVGRVAQLLPKPPSAYKQHKSSKCLTGTAIALPESC